ncbi:MAG: NADH-quinone oxidoreductase subunit NuoN [Proteobacteria bacterium]|nr:NADH-quinone oxidoreductase subunit NuoN [Pseudomonadota bacterium]MCH8187767.1 NADH-quinone oxidoreductase subunit NuoN [Pseudomonadota bacterium]
MPTAPVPDLIPAIPEIWVGASALALLLYGVFRGNKHTREVAWLSVLVMAVAAVLMFAVQDGRQVTFSGAFVTDDFAVFAKSLILLGSAVALIISQGYIRNEKMERFEFPILILLATLGMMMMVSANDLLALYMGVELQSLALYVLAAFKRDSLRSTESGLKYFVLGALSSGILLYGLSLIYGFSGTTNFETLAALYSGPAAESPSIGLIIGLVFLIAGLAFKVSAVPFHMWTPDVYEGTATPVTAFLALAPKVAAMALFARVMVAPFIGLLDDWQDVIIVISMASMVFGAFAAIRQTNIKRLMAYSSIGHMGFALVGLAAGTEKGLQGVLIYLSIYLVMNIGAFAAILTMRVKGTMVESIDDLAGLSRTSPMMALGIAIFMFSLAGIPPLAGFFGKFYVFIAAVEADLMVLAIVGVLASVVGAFYYVRIVKIMYFDEPAEPFERPIGREMSAILTGSGILTLLFFIYPAPLVGWAQTAAAALVP